MTDLPWFDGSARPLDAILKLAGSYRLDSLITTIERALDAKARSRLSQAERVVLAVEALEAQVNNGGYNQFFFNSSSEYVPIIVESLTAIGCPVVAGLTAEAIETLNLPPDYTQGDVQLAAADMTEANDAVLATLDDRFYEYPDPIEERLFAYIVEHRHEIVLS